MTFKLLQGQESAQTMIRRIGYRPLGRTPKGELNCVRPLGGDYPRFHIYLQEEGDLFTFNLHLDQKKPSYEGTSAHGGEYDGETVRVEMLRVQEIIKNL
jgi:hypothetical protein